MTRRVRTIIVDSRQRDKKAYPSPNSYVVKLSDELRNVESLELVYAIYPTFGTESYVNLFVSELEERGSVVTLDSAEVSGAFTQLPLINPINEYTPARHFRSISSFRIPLAKLSRLTLRFTDAFGAPYVIQDHFLRFEAVCLERQRQRESDLVQSLPARDQRHQAAPHQQPQQAIPHPQPPHPPHQPHVPVYTLSSYDTSANYGASSGASSGATSGASSGRTSGRTSGAISSAINGASSCVSSGAITGASSGASSGDHKALAQLARSLNDLMAGDGGRKTSRRRN